MRIQNNGKWNNVMSNAFLTTSRADGSLQQSNLSSLGESFTKDLSTVFRQIGGDMSARILVHSDRAFNLPTRSVLTSFPF